MRTTSHAAWFDDAIAARDRQTPEPTRDEWITIACDAEESGDDALAAEAWRRAIGLPDEEESKPKAKKGR